MEKIKIIMDVDTGIDDAIAMFTALANDRFDVLGFTTVFGNRALCDTTKNTLKILELVNRGHIPVAQGAAKPLVNEFNPPLKSIVHGMDGLGDIKNPLPEPKIKPIDKSAVEFMADTLRNSKEKITLVPVGPMTNIAAFLVAHPELKEKIDKIVLMGGSTLMGNASMVAEANIIKDPEAAFILFNSGVQIYMAGLDATMQGYISFDELSEYEKNGNWLSDIVCEMCGIYKEHYQERMKADGLAMHDSLPLAWLLHPELVETEDLNVTVDINGRYTYGMTVTDRRNVTKKAPNVKVAVGVRDRIAFIDLIKNAIEKLAKEK